MRKFLLGAVAVAALASPLALSASAEAAPVISDAADCAPILPAPAVAEVHHTEYKYKPVVNGTGPTHWALSEQGTNILVKGVAYVRDGVKTQVVIDSPAVAEVVGVTCKIALPANPLSITLAQPADTNQFAWGKIVDHSFGSSDRGVNNGLLGITVTAKPGYVFKNGTTGTLASKTFTLAGVSMFSYPDPTFGDVVCHETQGTDTESIACTFAARADLAGTSGSAAWNSDYTTGATAGRSGVLTYTVNSTGTGYTGTVVYPAV